MDRRTLSPAVLVRRVVALPSGRAHMMLVEEASGGGDASREEDHALLDPGGDIRDSWC